MSGEQEAKEAQAVEDLPATPGSKEKEGVAQPAGHECPGVDAVAQAHGAEAPAVEAGGEPEGGTERPVGERAILTWKDRFSSGKDRVAVDVFRPSGQGQLPVVLLLHGAGPRKAEKHYVRLAESLARNGYLSLYVRYYDRGRRGRGNRSQWGQAISDALSFACRLDGADAERVGLVGYSLGAFLALGRAPADERVRAVVAYYGGISRSEPAGLAARMPPTLLLHGTADRVVPVRRSVEAFEAIREQGRPVDLLVYPKVRHGFCLNSRSGVDAEAAADSWGRTLAFLDHHLGAGVPGVRGARPEAGGETRLPAYLSTVAVGGGSVPLINPDAQLVQSLVPPRPPRRSRPARSHRAVTAAAPAPARAP